MSDAWRGAWLLAALFCSFITEGAEPASVGYGNSSAAPFDFPGAGGGIGYTGTRDSDGFVTQRARVGALVQQRSPYDFLGIAAGTEYFRQADWSERGYSLLGVLEKRDRETAAGVSAVAGVMHVESRDLLFADAVWNHRYSTSTGSELMVQRDIVESRAGLQQGITQTYAAGTLEHAFTDRLTTIVLAGGQHFSDDNDRAHLRGWLIYTLLPEHGLSLQARARAYESSRQGSAFYFNPEHYQNGDVGLRWRGGVAGWRFHAVLAAGEEKIDRAVTHPTKFAQFHLDRVLTGDIRVGIRYAYSRAAGDGTPAGGGNGDYTWRYLRFVLVAPF